MSTAHAGEKVQRTIVHLLFPLLTTRML